MRSSLFAVVVGVTLLASLPGGARAELADLSGRRAHARRPKPARVEPTKPAAEADKPDAEAEPELPPGAVKGPGKVKLDAEAELDLPAGYLFLPKDTLNKILTKKGDPPDERAVGGVFTLSNEEGKSHWFLLEWNASGFVKDDDADDLKPDEILKSYQEGTEAGNEVRKKNGAVPFHVTGWDEKPRYDKAKKHVVWALRIHGDDNDESTNYNTRLLGRNGYLSLNLICAPNLVESLKPTAADMLNRVNYLPGKRYADYNKSTDKTAEFGVAALVLGGAALAGKAVKLGLLAKFGKVLIAILIAGKKAVVLFLIGIYAFFKRLFGGKTTPAPVADPTVPTGSADASSEPAKASDPLAPTDSAAVSESVSESVSTSASASEASSAAAPPGDEPGKSL